MWLCFWLGHISGSLLQSPCILGSVWMWQSVHRGDWKNVKTNTHWTQTSSENAGNNNAWSGCRPLLGGSGSCMLRRAVDKKEDQREPDQRGQLKPGLWSIYWLKLDLILVKFDSLLSISPFELCLTLMVRFNILLYNSHISPQSHFCAIYVLSHSRWKSEDRNFFGFM